MYLAVKDGFRFYVLGFRFPGSNDDCARMPHPCPKAAPQERTPSSVSSRSFVFFAVENGFKNGFRF
ncbi:MAG: hypothetical protein WC124_13765, partial [Desulfoplanes sp.]